ncbi:Lig chan, ANF receptor and/or SBP bac 3 domain containing protein [Asbolus verrucosus]|uniref:Lig chan, ANF receptor and/or SBP bac 3 domain containing protein n=1 Tax=Asbolus verrucosus TaxID=1661398 RepID=A0A482VWI8_ASBVE|nr:Lig chan, ANF receptor and/or SBP bac 3 domain containing protein [Asbolus verrucosus]
MVATCSLMEQGVVGILGPSLEHNSRTVQSICDEKDIPYLDVRWVDEPRTPIINFYPSQSVLTQVYIDIITAWGYKDFVILFDDTESLKRVARFLSMYEDKSHKIVLRQLDRYRSGDYSSVLKELRKSGATHFVLDCSLEVLKDVLEQAQRFGLMTDKYNYFVTNLDLHTLELVAYQFSETNITGIRISDPNSEAMQNLGSLIFQEEIQANPMFGVRAAWKLQLETILIVDAVMMFGKVLKEFSEKLIPKSIDCEDNERWVLGLTFTNLLKGDKKQYSGLSGIIEFDPKGYRNYFVVDVIELKEGGIAKVGNWSLQENLIINRNYDKIVHHNNETIKKKPLKVLISLIEPFAMLTPTAGFLTGNDRYQGFGIDLIHELSLMKGFTYTILNQEDKRNGDFDENTKKWGGMIGEIMEGRADLAIADLTITAERQQAVDFTAPFMNLGISILYQKPRKAPPSFFSFADPFALEVWIFVALSYFTISMVLFILGRICSSEWINPYPCIENPEFLVNQLSLRNCFWFVSGSIMQQGTEIGPLALSTRLIAGIWWFFTLIMVSSYTANLAVFLTRETPIPHFNDVNELVKNAEAKNIKWGAKNARHRNKAYGEIYDYMMAHSDDVLVSDTRLGVERAERENYAFFMEITSIQYETQRRCNLTDVGKLLDEKSYGIAMKKSMYLNINVLSRAILDLQHSGKLNELQRKWWEENQGGGFCELRFSIMIVH